MITNLTANKVYEEMSKHTSVIWAKYQRIKIQKSAMPLFISFHPGNLIKLTVSVEDSKLPTLLKSISGWFEKLQVLKVEKEER